MAAAKKPVCTIDNLPEVRRRQVVDAILVGTPIRTIAKMAGCSFQAIADYKKRIILPAVEKAQQIQHVHTPIPTRPAATDFQHVEQQTLLTRDVIRTSPFRERLEALWERTNQALDYTKPGSENFGLHPQLLNQAHKNLDLLGRVTGELQDQKSPSVAIQIVVPNVGNPTAGVDPTVDIALPSRK